MVYPTGVASVNEQTGRVDLDAADVDAPGVADALDVAEAATVVVNRPLMVSPGSAADVWRFTYAGQRTGYANEYGNLRSRGAQDQVAFRCQCHSSDNGTAQNILDVARADNTSLFSVDALGDAYLTTGDLVIQGTVYGPVSAWTAPAFETNAADVGSPKYPAGFRLEALAIVRGRGEIALSGTFNSGATICTLPANCRPAADVSFTVRTAGTGAANTFLDIAGTTGALSIRTNLGSGARVYLDGLAFPVAA